MTPGLIERLEAAKSKWERDGKEVAAAVRGLTKAERRFVKAGCIHGDFRMNTVRNLKRKGMFYLKITSPNGQCGFMELTPLGLNAQAILKARATQEQETLSRTKANRRGGQS